MAVARYYVRHTGPGARKSREVGRRSLCSSTAQSYLICEGESVHTVYFFSNKTWQEYKIGRFDSNGPVQLPDCVLKVWACCPSATR